MSDKTFLLLLISFAVLCNLYSLYRKYRPHIATVILPYNRRKIFFEYWEPYTWHDKNGNRVWSRRIKRVYLFTL